MPITTTLNAIRECHPSAAKWNKLLAHLGKTAADDEPLPLTTILDNSGIDDTLWVLFTLKIEKANNIAVAFAADCADRVLIIFENLFPGDNRPQAAVDIARKYAVGVDVTTDIPRVAEAARIASDVAYASLRSHNVAALAARAAALAACIAADAAYAAANGYVIFGKVVRVASIAADAVFTATDAANLTREAAGDASAVPNDVAYSSEREWQIARLRELLEADV